jgi:glycosyltransferase involved in cell wall biosynthesis
MVSAEPLKMAQVVAVYPPYRGGLGTVAAEYTNRLTVSGDFVTVFTPYHSRSLRDHEGHLETLHPLFKCGKGAVLPQLLTKLRNFDIIHLHYPFFGSDILVALASLIWRKPLVITYHMTPVATGSLGLFFRWYRFVFQPFIFWRASKILVNSPEYGNAAKLPKSKMVVLPFGVDTVRFTPGRADAWRAENNIAVDATVIIFVGGLDRHHYFKGLYLLLNALATQIADASWQLLVVGSGELQQSFIDIAAKLSLASRVHFVGSVPFASLPLAYQAADIHILPSINSSEAFGLVTIEAAASGIPSIVTDLPGVRNIVIPHETGLIVAPNDAVALANALHELLKNDGRRELMGAAARVRAEKEYDAVTLITTLREIYRTL